MTTTQYIGARYVPLFADPLDWSIESTYEALTIVYDSGNSYTSRQAVPKGIDITNTKYWALTGNYNAQIEAYRKEVAAYDGRITENASAIAKEVSRAIAEETSIKALITKAQTAADNALSLAQTNEKDIATLDSEMAGTADSGLKTLITKNEKDIATLDSEMAGTADSGLKTLITNNASAISAEAARAEAAENNITAETAHYTLKAGYDYNSLSHYKFFTFPKKYYPLSKLNISIALSSHIENRNYGKWLQSKTEGVYVNGPMDGPVVVGGKAIIEKATSTAEAWYVLKETNGVFTSVKDVSHAITASQLVSQNVDMAFCVWHPIAENNVKFDASNIPTTEDNREAIINNKHPRTIFGFDDDNWYIVLIEGRGYINAGATFDESYNLVASLGIKNAYQMDGGHSVQLWNVNPIFNYAYQNSSTKGYGFASGSMFCFLEFHK